MAFMKVHRMSARAVCTIRVLGGISMFPLSITAYATGMNLGRTIRDSPEQWAAKVAGLPIETGTAEIPLGQLLRGDQLSEQQLRRRRNVADCMDSRKNDKHIAGTIKQLIMTMQCQESVNT
eukprot:5655706-Karenia_brevis.AAC.1